MISAMHNTTGNIHRRNRPIISLLQSIITGIVVQDVVFVLQVVQPLTTSITCFSFENKSAKEPLGDASVAEARVIRRHAPLKKV